MSLPYDTTEMSHKKPFWHNLASPLRERQPTTTPPPPSTSRFRALAPNQYLLNRSSKQRGGEVIDQTPLGISATNYCVPENYKGAPSRLLVEQEVIFFDNQDQENEDCSSLFDGAWEGDSSIDDSEISSSSSSGSVEIPPPPTPTARVRSAEPNDTENDEGSKSSDLSRSSSGSSIRRSKAASVKITASMDSVLTSPPPVTKRGGLTIFNRNRSDTKRKAKDIVELARDKDCGDNTLATFTSVAETHSAVSIFLLLLESESKMFELIQLRYPRTNTTVDDLLRMIPKNATEKKLAEQSYVGITRPHRSSVPIHNLNLLASNSVSTAAPSANIVPGEIILAIPAHASSKKIVALAKQILANAHIQKLMNKKKASKSASSKKKASSKHNISSRKSTSPPLAYEHPTDPPPTPIPTSTNSTLESQRVQHIGTRRASSNDGSDNSESSTTPLLHAVFSTFETPGKPQTPSSDILVNKKIVCKTGGLEETDTEDLQRVVDTAMKQLSPVGVDEECTNAAAQLGLSTPGDMLNAFLSKEDLMKMCRTRRPNDESNILDNMSCGDSADAGSSLTTTNSLQSWSRQQSLNSSVASRYAAMQLEDEISALRRQAIFRKRRFARQMKTIKRISLVLWMASIVRYCTDPNGLQAADTRTHILEEPLGVVGFLQFLLCFVSLLKFQKLFQQPAVPLSQSRCPALQWISQVLESRVAGTNAGHVTTIIHS